MFVYAETKRDLLFLVVNDDLEAAVAAARAAFDPARPMRANLLAIVRLHYALMIGQPDIWRLALREMYFYATGPQAERFLKTRDKLIRLFAEVVAAGMKAAGARADAALAGWMVFALFQVDVRRLLMAETVDVDAAVKDFGRQLKVLSRGLLGEAPREGRPRRR